MATDMLEKAAGYVLAPFQSPEALLAALDGAVTAVASLQSKTGWLYLLTSAAIAALLFGHARKTGQSAALSLRSFVFPREIYLHPSAVVDYKFVAIDLTIKAALYTPFISGLSYLVYKLALGSLQGLVGPEAPAAQLIAGSFAAPLLALLVADFGFFLSHYLMHRVPELWCFHQVHHSAEVLTPVTVYRTHPVEDLMNGLVAALLTGIAAALYGAANAVDVGMPTLLGVSVAQFLFFAAAFQLRHSHIWLCYGPALSRIFISPAQHQIHHSVAAKHWDKNYGFLFAFWDALFGSLYVPRGREALAFGIPALPHGEFGSVARIYFRPFANAARVMRERVRRRRQLST